ncbi:MAG: hypothetical protein AAFW83_12215 [Pseudomonadota bacterium]
MVNCDEVATAYEEDSIQSAMEKRLLQERVEDMLEPHKPFSDTYHRVMTILTALWVNWKNGNHAVKRMMARLIMPPTMTSPAKTASRTRKFR